MKKCGMEVAHVCIDMQGYVVENLQDWGVFDRLDHLTGIQWVRDKWAIRQELGLSGKRHRRTSKQRPYPLFDNPRREAA